MSTKSTRQASSTSNGSSKSGRKTQSPPVRRAFVEKDALYWVRIITMLLDKAQQIKAQLRYFEGRKTDAGTHAVWKILLCPRGHSREALIRLCKDDFNYDDIFSALHYREEIDIYIVYRDGDSFFAESFDEFTGSHTQ